MKVKKKMGRDILLELEMEQERHKTAHERYVNLECALRYMLLCLQNPVDMEDFLSVDNIKQCIIVYLARDKYEEKNDVFLSNMTHLFYSEIERLEKKHPDIKRKTTIVKLFMEDFCFK